MITDNDIQQLLESIHGKINGLAFEVVKKEFKQWGYSHITTSQTAESRGKGFEPNYDGSDIPISGNFAQDFWNANAVVIVPIDEGRYMLSPEKFKEFILSTTPPNSEAIRQMAEEAAERCKCDRHEVQPFINGFIEGANAIAGAGATGKVDVGGKIKIMEVERYRDGGTIVYEDEIGRRYFQWHPTKKFYNQWPFPHGVLNENTKPPDYVKELNLEFEIVENNNLPSRE